MNKKQFERLAQLITNQESKARVESEDRQKKIKLLWDLPDLTAESFKRRKLKAQKLEKVLDSVINLTADLIEPEKRDLIDRVSELVELAGLQDREIEYLTQFRRKWEQILAYDPEKLKSLSSASWFAELQPLFEKLSAEEKPKKAWERKRRRNRWVRLIEYEFGGDGEAEWRKSWPLSGLLGLHYQPSCLDDILRGGVGEVKTLSSIAGSIARPPITVDTLTNMRRLEALFGMHRNRFPKKLPRRRMGREIVYDWRAVVKIMRALLSEKPRDRARLTPGRPRRLWLSDPSDSELRARVLSGIEERIYYVRARPKIARAFLTLIHRTVADSAKK